MKKFDAKNYNIREVLTRLGIEAPKGNNNIHCPSPDHDDKNPSCAVYPHWIRCHSLACAINWNAVDLVMAVRGCDFKEAMKFLDGVSPPDKAKKAFDSIPDKNGKMSCAAVYRYYDDDGGKVMLQVARYEDGSGKKSYMPFSTAPDGKLYSCAPGETPIYQLHRTIRCDNIVIVEGEKAADALNKLMDTELWKGWCAITALGGSSRIPKADFSKCGTGKTFMLWADNDDAGRKCMSAVAVKLRQCQANLICDIVIQDDWAPGYDAADFVNDGGNLGGLQSIMSKHTKLETDPIAVKPEKIEEPAKEYNPCEYADDFFPLGHKGSHYFFYSVRGGKVISLTARELVQPNLIALAGGIHFWQHQYGGGGEKFSISKAPLAQIQSDLIAASHNKGIYEISRKYSRGWHTINGERILHTGDSVITADGIITIADAARKYNAAIERDAPIPWGKPGKKYQTKIGEKWCALSDALLWQNPVFAKALVGWSALAPITGILSFRPAMWITGPATCGKSTIIRDTLPCLLGFTYRYRTDITAAGAKRKEVIALGIDEMEEDKENANLRQERNKMLKIMRSTSGNSAPIEQADGSGKNTIEFNPTILFAYAGITRHDLGEADTSRILNLQLGRKHDETKEDAAARLIKQLDNNGNRLDTFLHKPDNNGNSESVKEFLNFILTHIDELQEAITRAENIARRHNKAGRSAELAGAVFGAYAFTLLNGDIQRDNYKAFDSLAEIAMTEYFTELKREDEISPSAKNPFQIILDHEIEVNFPSTTQFNKPFIRKKRVGVILNAVLNEEPLTIPGYDGSASPDNLWLTLANFGIIAPLEQGDGTGYRGKRSGPDEGFIWIEAASADIKELFAKKCGYSNYQPQLTANGGEFLEGQRTRRHSTRRIYFISAAIANVLPDFAKDGNDAGDVNLKVVGDDEVSNGDF
ncbi:MAG: hypothetical protein ACR2PR_09080 [Pseudohongiellaceae bacterium]